MLPVVDRPLIQHVVDEARDAGIEHFIFVTGRNKAVIEDHFDRQFELEAHAHRAPAARAISRRWRATCRGRAPRASRASSCRWAWAMRWCARELVGHEPFALLLPDMLIQHNPGCLAQMIDAARGVGDSASVIAVEQVPHDRVHMYGVVGVGERKGKLFSLTEMVEKPPRERRRTSSPAATFCSPRFSASGGRKRGAGGEISSPTG